MFVAFDGIDGAGKSTQIELVKEWLTSQSRPVVSFRDPGATKLGEAVREILLHREDIPLSMASEMLLYMAARAQLVAEEISPALDIGKIVLCDRFLLANVVYQGVAGGLEVEELWSIGRTAIQNRKPDVTILLDLDAKIASQRVSKSQDRLEKRGLEFFQAVRQGFLDQVHRASPKYLIVDASRDIEDIQNEIRVFLSPLLIHV